MSKPRLIKASKCQYKRGQSLYPIHKGLNGVRNWEVVKIKKSTRFEGGGWGDAERVEIEFYYIYVALCDGSASKIDYFSTAWEDKIQWLTDEKKAYKIVKEEGLNRVKSDVAFYEGRLLNDY